MIGRRSFITGLIALVAAPAIVRAGSLMPVKQMIGPLATVDASNQIGGQLIINRINGSLRAPMLNMRYSDDAGHTWSDPRHFVVTAEAKNGERIVNIYPPILTPDTPQAYGYGPTAVESPHNRAELKLVEWPPTHSE